MVRVAGSPSNTVWPGPRRTCMPSFIFIHPTVWPQYTNVTDRQDRTTVRWHRANRFTNGRPKTFLHLGNQPFPNSRQVHLCLQVTFVELIFPGGAHPSTAVTACGLSYRVSRLKSAIPLDRGVFARFGASKHRFSGRTYYQSHTWASTVTRPQPYFERTGSRMTASATTSMTCCLHQGQIRNLGRGSSSQDQPSVLWCCWLGGRKGI